MATDVSPLEKQSEDQNVKKVNACIFYQMVYCVINSLDFETSSHFQFSQ